ncbi:MAG: DUF885 domain-containing protein [Candidatus Melainabacteria bacterium]|nr:DUF885 domain-containing protein [Candidatus Melainabacteria bacterium]
MSFRVPKTFTWLAISLLLMTSGAAMAPVCTAQDEVKPQQDAKEPEKEPEKGPSIENVKSDGKEASAAAVPAKEKRDAVSAPVIKTKGSSKYSKSSQAKESVGRVDAGKYYYGLVDTYFDGVFKYEPHYATEMGIHTYDGLLPDMSAEGVKKQTRFLKDSLKKFEQVDAASLSQKDRLDLVLVVNQIKDRLLEIESVGNYKRNPSHYSELACAAVFALMKRNFAEPSERLKSVIAREKAIPEMLKSGRANILVEAVPKVFAEIDLEQLPGIISFFEDDVPAAFQSVKNEALNQEFDLANKAAVAALKEHEAYVRKEILPKAKGNYALGAELYKKKLLYQEMVDEPIDSLYQRGMTELRRLQKDFARSAHALDPNRSALKVFESVSAKHPEPGELVDAVKKCLEDLRRFCVEKPILTVPSEDRATVAQTPPFARALSFASMDTPGPYEKNAKEAYYFVTLPEKDWPAKRAEEHMRSFSYQDLLNTSVHEAYPGHYVQFLWVNINPSKVRKLTGCGSNVEGWAHYCEQMMVDEGLGSGDLKLRLAQLHDALLRCCRYLVAIKMHTEKMTVAEATDFFVKEGFQERANGEREAKRGTSDPTYLVYTLGKLQIISLRDEYKKFKGQDYSLKAFHDAFLSTGCPPVKLVRAELLNDFTAFPLNTRTAKPTKKK